MTEKELLSIVDTLVEHTSILHGAKIFAYSYHKNLAHANTTHASARVQTHRSLLEEFGCTAFHMPGEKNELADALSRLPMKELTNDEEVEEVYRLRKTHEDRTQLPITLSVIKNNQEHSK